MDSTFVALFHIGSHTFPFRWLQMSEFTNLCTEAFPILYANLSHDETIRTNASLHAAPALEVVKDDYEVVRFISSYKSQSPYKGPPSPDVDAAWDRIIEGRCCKNDIVLSNINIVGAMSITQETLDRINASEHAVKLPDESGGGYLAILEVFHQLHCVVRPNSHSKYHEF